MRKYSFYCSSLSAILICFFLFFADTAFSASIKERMAARQPAITSLKDQGIIGENNSGFLEFLGSKKDASTVAEENRDRGMVYDAIAKKQGVDAALVGARRAKMNAERGPKGHWFEKADGKWYKK